MAKTTHQPLTIPKSEKIAYINDQKSILCAKKEKAPDKDGTS